jgi:hypothetical protein
LGGRRVCWSFGMGLRWIHKQKFKMKSTCTTKKRGHLVQVEYKWCGVDLIRIISSTSFTQLATCERRHHCLSYSILCDFSHGHHPNDIFPQDSQVGVPKLGLLLSWKFGSSYLLQNKPIWNTQGQCRITLKEIFAIVYCISWLEII